MHLLRHKATEQTIGIEIYHNTFTYDTINDNDKCSVL